MVFELLFFIIVTVQPKNWSEFLALPLKNSLSPRSLKTTKIESHSRGLEIRAHLRYDTILLFCEQIAPSRQYLSAQIHAHVVVSRVDVVTLCDQIADFSHQKQGIRTRTLICSFMLQTNCKSEFFRTKNKTSISCCEWIIPACVCCSRKP